MMDWNYEIALTEVDEILNFTDTELVNKIPVAFRKFIEKNKNKDYRPNITPGIPISEQVIKKETEAILSLIFRSYWATEEEKRELEKNDKITFEMLKAETEIKFPKSSMSTYSSKVNDLKQNKTEEKEIHKNMQLISIEDMPWYKKIFIKLLKIFKLRN
jgi:hypothetical protein